MIALLPKKISREICPQFLLLGRFLMSQSYRSSLSRIPSLLIKAIYRTKSFRFRQSQSALHRVLMFTNEWRGMPVALTNRFFASVQNNTIRKVACVTTLMSTAFLTLPAFSMPAATVQSVLFDADENVLTIGPYTSDVFGDPVQNGDFTIFRIPTAEDTTVGNGIDDRASGIFDFRNDALYTDFTDILGLPKGMITGATLRLILSRTPFELFENDQISLENGPFVDDGYPPFTQIGEQLTINPFLKDASGEDTVFKQVTLNLFDFYTSQQLENFLSGGTGDFVNDGRIVLTYGDDAILSGAALTLTARTVPEPGTLALFSLALLPVFANRWRKSVNA